MITREDIRSTYMTSQEGWEAVEELFNAELAQYTALVDAAVAWHDQWDHSCVLASDESRDLYKAVQTFIKPMLSEKLDKLAEIASGGHKEKLRQFADEARELEK